MGVIFFLIVLALGVFGYGFVRALWEGPDVPSEQHESPAIVRGIKRLVFSGNRLLDGYEDNRINVLFLGVGGAGHDGPQLSDTIMLASFRPSDEQVALLSIPRDMAVNIPGYGVNKVNHANAYGEQNDAGHGGDLAVQVLSDVLDEPIHYWVRVDFSAFEKIVDTLGGLEIDIDQSFVDKEYPTDDFGYQTIVFERGVELMDGARALQFSRSRHGSHGEGSDFARARRQQKIVSALREKILTPGVLANPIKLTSLFNTLTTHIDTDLNIIELVEFAQKVKNIQPHNIVTHVLSTGQGQYLQEITNDYGYFLVPKAGDYSDIAHFVDNMFDTLPAPPPAPVVTDVSAYRDARVIVLNGTWEPGLASTVRERLLETGISVARIGNTPQRSYTKSVIHQITINEKTDAALSRIVPLLNMEVIREVPAFTLEDNADMVIIIGTDFSDSLYGSDSGTEN